MTALLALTLALTCAPQPGSQAGDDDASVLARFDGLPVLRQVMLVRRIEQQLDASDDPTLRRIRALRAVERDLPDAPVEVFFDPDEWTHGVAPPRRVVPSTDPAHHAVRQSMPEIAVLPDLARAVEYDWRTGRVVARRPAPAWRERFANLLHGYPPHSDAAYARVLAALDRDPLQRRLADYFEHTYADREGGVYEGVSLYEAWYAGEILEMPDVDAIPFATRVLGDRSFVSPIPADARRDQLYGAIRASALAHRKYRTMLQAAAAAFVRAEPEMDPMYARLAPRFHFLWQRAGDDPHTLAEILVHLGSRDALIDYVDGLVVKDARALAPRDGRQREVAATARAVRAAALRALDEEKTPSTAGKRPH